MKYKNKHTGRIVELKQDNVNIGTINFPIIGIILYDKGKEERWGKPLFHEHFEEIIMPQNGGAR